MINVMPSEYSLFVSYGRKTKEFLKKVFYLYRLPKEENVDIEYATPSRAFAKYLVPVLNGGNLNPTITFYFENAEYIDNENLLGFTKEYKKVGNIFRAIPPPQIYRLNYKVSISAATPTDADKLTYQLLAYANKNKKMFDKMDGQWIEWYAHSPAEDGNIEPGLEDKVVKRTLMLTVPRVYLPIDFAEFGIINSIQVTTSVEDDINAL